MNEYYKIEESKKLIACIGDVGSTVRLGDVVAFENRQTVTAAHLSYKY
jgi:hypothetical protein